MNSEHTTFVSLITVPHMNPAWARHVLIVIASAMSCM